MNERMAVQDSSDTGKNKNVSTGITEDAFRAFVLASVGASLGACQNSSPSTNDNSGESSNALTLNCEEFPVGDLAYAKSCEVMDSAIPNPAYNMAHGNVLVLLSSTTGRFTTETSDFTDSYPLLNPDGQDLTGGTEQVFDDVGEPMRDIALIAFNGNGLIRVRNPETGFFEQKTDYASAGGFGRLAGFDGDTIYGFRHDGAVLEVSYDALLGEGFAPVRVSDLTRLIGLTNDVAMANNGQTIVVGDNEDGIVLLEKVPAPIEIGSNTWRQSEDWDLWDAIDQATNYVVLQDGNYIEFVPYADGGSTFGLLARDSETDDQHYWLITAYNREVPVPDPDPEPAGDDAGIDLPPDIAPDLSGGDDPLDGGTVSDLPPDEPDGVVVVDTGHEVSPDAALDSRSDPSDLTADMEVTERGGDATSEVGTDAVDSRDVVNDAGREEVSQEVEVEHGPDLPAEDTGHDAGRSEVSSDPVIHDEADMGGSEDAALEDTYESEGTPETPPGDDPGGCSVASQQIDIGMSAMLVLAGLVSVVRRRRMQR